MIKVSRIDRTERGTIMMYQVYTKKGGSDLTKTQIGEFSDLEEALDFAEKAIEGKPDLKYIVESTSGHFNSYGELLVEVVAQSE